MEFDGSHQALRQPTRASLEVPHARAGVPRGSSVSSEDVLARRPSTSDVQARRAAPHDQSAEFFERTTLWRKGLMAKVHETWRSTALGDPDMWPWWRACLGHCIDTIWVDVSHELERRLGNALKGVYIENTDDVKPPFTDAPLPAEGSRLCLLRAGACSWTRFYWLRFRAYVLNHYFAHDLSFFGKLHDRVFLLMLLVTTIPVTGMRESFFSVVLFMLLFPGPPDEFQLVNYILVIKGTQFLTSGLAGLSSGAMRYFMCYTFFKDEFLQCVERHGPGARGSYYGQLLNYFGSTVLVWIAFSRLDTSKKHASVDVSGHADPPPKDTWQKLRWLLYYDMACFALSLLLLGLLAGVTCSVRFWKHGAVDGVAEGKDFHANLFWCTTLYALLSLPFFAMKWIPGALTVLTHTTNTGYNTHGACVAFRFRATADAGEGELAPQGPPAWSSGQVAVNLTRLLRLAERGRAARGEDHDGSVDLGVLIAGVFPRWTGFLTRRRQCREDRRRQRMQSADGRPAAQSPARSSPDEAASSSPRPGRLSLRRRFAGRAASREPLAQPAPEPPREGASAASAARGPPWRLLLHNKSHAVLDSIVLPPDGIEQQSEDKKTVYYFSIDVSASEGAWRVRRRYAEFLDLHKRLDGFGHTDAPFPSKMYYHTDARLEARRGSLELWLRSVVDDPRSASEEGWAAHVCDFLDNVLLVNCCLDGSFVSAHGRRGAPPDAGSFASSSHGPHPDTGSFGSAHGSQRGDGPAEEAEEEERAVGPPGGAVDLPAAAAEEASKEDEREEEDEEEESAGPAQGTDSTADTARW